MSMERPSFFVALLSAFAESGRSFYRGLSPQELGQSSIVDRRIDVKGNDIVPIVCPLSDGLCIARLANGHAAAT